ncbi:tyrosine-type recombinase/integrase [Streptomyces sp. RS2]|uniref:tyrosine-type recombinase/integrase n=1 Tax=Streptomyces sp. RS2 TaxID=1451205 RepID=UPI0021F8388D|nr:tyrosine-type recombinase/integrase [Streptomyces sp. RS2]MCW1100171.1 tyrosine-type recombinase/integrase [Streptomyces sp. RS2]
MRLTLQDIHLGSGPHLRCHGKGRRDRCTPLTSDTVKVLKIWLKERGGERGDPLFPTRRGTPLSRDAVEALVTKHTRTAAVTCPSLADKHVTPHTLRHSTAMALLHAGVDVSVIALWLGHESTETTQIYLHADMTIKNVRSRARLPPAALPDVSPLRTTCWRSSRLSEPKATGYANRSEVGAGLIMLSPPQSA